MLAFLDDLAARDALADVREVVTRIHDRAIVRVDVPVAAASLFLQAGDGWDVGRRRLSAELVVGGRTVDRVGAPLLVALLRRLGVALAQREQPAL